MTGGPGQDRTSSARVGQPAPSFSVACTWAGGRRTEQATLVDYAGSWLMLLFYPRDFTFVCPAELVAFSARFADLRRRGCRVLAVSSDALDIHREWLSLPRAEGGLGPLRYPLASDPDGAMARAYGVWDAERALATRGLFLIDPDGVLQYAVVHNLGVGRNPDEVLRVLDALREGGLCPPSWTLGDGTIDPLRELGPGRVLGHYQILEKLGEGGFAHVYRAHDRELDRSVALKVIKPGSVVDLPRVQAEARVIAAVDHPGVCAIHALEQDAGLPFLVMEYCGGGSLAQRLHRHRLDEVEAAAIAGEIATALAAAHEAGVVHGDLKPSNIALSGAGRVKVLDFGIGLFDAQGPAAMAGHPAAAGPERGPADDRTTIPLPGNEERPRGPGGGAASVTLERPRMQIRGTPAYLSPEQLQGRRPTPASDVYTLGLVLFEMITGERAVPSGAVEETLERARALRPEQLTARLPPRLRGLVYRCLHRDPAARPSMAYLARQLQRSQAA